VDVAVGADGHTMTALAPTRRPAASPGPSRSRCQGLTHTDCQLAMADNRAGGTSRATPPERAPVGCCAGFADAQGMSVDSGRYEPIRLWPDGPGVRTPPSLSPKVRTPRECGERTRPRPPEGNSNRRASRTPVRLPVVDPPSNPPVDCRSEIWYNGRGGSSTRPPQRTQEGPKGRTPGGKSGRPPHHRTTAPPRLPPEPGARRLTTEPVRPAGRGRNETDRSAGFRPAMGPPPVSTTEAPRGCPFPP
jgi:hypothetical protein